ncbi:MAG: glycosyl hydrolase 53 family protein [Bacteroidales bacterium]|nr:glycosyl hydrolase 53 family protein [Bacteroidales bacterium]
MVKIKLVTHKNCSYGKSLSKLSMLSILFVLAMVIAACNKNDQLIIKPADDPFLRAADMSFLPHVRESGIVVYNLEGQPEDMLQTLKNAGVNAIRLRLWNNPTEVYAGMEEVKILSQEIKSRGMKVWLTLHYSDTWADPGTQLKPALWQNISFDALKDSVYAFTQLAVEQIQPDIIQIGNEINNGFLWPEGSKSNIVHFRALLERGIAAVRESDTAVRIMLHYAGHEDAPAFFEQLKLLDFDQIGLSYYPLWHGKDLNALQASMQELSAKYAKDIVIAETAYPFTFGWNDWTNNIIGSQDQILAEYPASEQGQLDFLVKLRALVDSVSTGKGFCYWGSEWVAFRGPQATNGSSWENQALWDFTNKALPVMEAFEKTLYD